ncbi:unnamed protein product [Enterobius vermicularis]|uniref:Uncharacterized protein n=1 Tax=Enterobius vermicularis TaxID=51028 RepID=A0A0N4VRU8_ENTVE|nr:unnamed protein product [Enterobius vermicularis]
MTSWTPGDSDGYAIWRSEYGAILHVPYVYRHIFKIETHWDPVSAHYFFNKVWFHFLFLFFKFFFYLE